MKYLLLSPPDCRRGNSRGNNESRALGPLHWARVADVLKEVGHTASILETQRF